MSHHIVPMSHHVSLSHHTQRKTSFNYSHQHISLSQHICQLTHFKNCIALKKALLGLFHWCWIQLESFIFMTRDVIRTCLLSAEWTLSGPYLSYLFFSFSAGFFDPTSIEPSSPFQTTLSLPTSISWCTYWARYCNDNLCLVIRPQVLAMISIVPYYLLLNGGGMCEYIIFTNQLFTVIF
jgi:hypothetical protein